MSQRLNDRETRYYRGSTVQDLIDRIVELEDERDKFIDKIVELEDERDRFIDKIKSLQEELKEKHENIENMNLEFLDGV